jgi:hypothetical protein
VPKYVRSFNPPGVLPTEQFGTSIAIDPLSGERILVGAPGANNGAGAVYAYSYDFEHDTWVLKQRIVQPDRQLGDVGFGESVSLTINEAVIGAPRARLDPVTGTSGLAFRMQRAFLEDRWSVGPAFRPFDLAGWSRFGHKVFIDSNMVVISAPGASEPVPTAGNVYLYRRSAFPPYVPQIQLTGHQRDSRFGSDFGASASGNYMYVGEPFYRTAPTRNEGVATRYLYQY